MLARFCLISCFLLCCLSLSAQTETTIQICQSEQYAHETNPESIDKSCFEAPTGEKTKESAWLKIIVKDRDKEILLFDKNVDYASIKTDGQELLTGNLVPVSEQSLYLTTQLHTLPIPTYDQAFYVFVRNDRNLSAVATPQVLSKKEFEQEYLHFHDKSRLFQVFFQGAVWIILLYNFSIFIATRERVYLSYSLYLLGLSLFAAQNTGIIGDFIIKELPILSYPIRTLSLTLLYLSYYQFILLFLPDNTINSFWRKNIKILLIVILTTGLLYVFLILVVKNLALYILLSLIGYAIFLINGLIFFVHLRMKHWDSVIIKYFLVGSSIVILAALIYTIFRNSEFMVNHGHLLVEGGAILEILIFSLGLGYRMKALERKHALFLEKQNQVLEDKVTERTKEITLQKEEIMVQNEELHQQQEEIVSQRDYIEQQNEQLKHSNTRFTDSIRYAQTIQEAILPFEAVLKGSFDEHFVIFKPKDIVSGDFYWLYNYQDKRTNKQLTLVAVVDCTGHGVPGAFISLIGYALLNEIVAKEHITSPKKILKRLDQRLQIALRQNQSSNNDGMDIALCSLEKQSEKSFELIFSGAKRPLYVIKDGELLQYKGNRTSIGGITRKKKRTESELFTEETILLEKGDTIYLTTDGLADQNDSQRQKIGIVSLKNQLTQNADKPLSEQKISLEKRLQLHQGKEKQRDDITILGLKL